MNNTLPQLNHLVEMILDIEQDVISPESYLIRELGAESIDLLELAVKIAGRFKIEVTDDLIFLKKFRMHLDEAKKQNTNDPFNILAGLYPHLTEERLKEISGDLEKGPALKIKDIAAYINWKRFS